MSRRKQSDRRVAKILAAFDKMVTLPEYRRPIAEGNGNVYLCYFMQCITLSIIDGYLIPGGWTADAARAVLVPYLTNCPVAYLIGLVAKAEDELADCVDADRLMRNANRKVAA
ncbi:MAG: hypothetical protein ABI591_09690 [Kofleriaceae bacterium]